MRKLALFAGLLALAAVTPANAWAAEAPTCSASCITEYPVPVPVVYNGPFGIAPGPGGMWFGDQDMIVRIDSNGNFTRYALPSAGAAAGWVARGSDGNMWFTERGTSKIGSIDGSGQITEYTVPTPNSVPQAVVQDSDGIVWFTEQAGNKIGRLDPSTGSFAEYPVPTANAGVLGLAVGPDGALWFTERNAAKVGRMDTSGNFREYSLTPGSSPQRIVAGPDGALWFTELAGNKVGRITTGGQLTEYPLAPGSRPVGVAVLSGDRAVWIAEFGSSEVARMALDGTVTNEYPTPSPAATPLQITAGPDRALWFTESFLSPNGNKIGRLAPFAHDLS